MLLSDSELRLWVRATPLTSPVTLARLLPTSSSGVKQICLHLPHGEGNVCRNVLWGPWHTVYFCTHQLKCIFVGRRLLQELMVLLLIWSTICQRFALVACLKMVHHFPWGKGNPSSCMCVSWLYVYFTFQPLCVGKHCIHTPSPHFLGLSHLLLSREEEIPPLGHPHGWSRHREICRPCWK